MKDLLIVCADKDAELLFKGLLPRMKTIEGYENIEYEIIAHPYHDSGIAHNVSEFVRPFITTHKFLLVVFDYEGCGMENEDENSVELLIKGKLTENGWRDRNAVVVIKPELEEWIWVNEVHLRAICDYQELSSIYQLLNENGFCMRNEEKPQRPKEAFEYILRYTETPRSSNLFANVASRASYQRCKDVSFKKFLDYMNKWFKNS
ncbi:MAG: methylation-associated defense system protein MAD4 [Candidatus Goldiibacteriota bacterium]